MLPQPCASEAETHGTGRRAPARPGRRLALLCGVVVLVVGGVRAVAESGALSAESPVVRSTISAGGGEGFGHSCGVRTTDGTVVCWGADDDGQATPPQGTFTQVSAGGFHTCGVQTQGTVACWGNDEIGQATPPGGTFTQVSAGNSHTCGVQTDGAVACWGDGGDAAGGNVHAGERGVRAYLRGADGRHPGLLGRRHVRTGRAAVRDVHPGQRGEQSHMRVAGRRHPGVLGAQRTLGGDVPAGGDVHPGECGDRLYLRGANRRHPGLLGEQRKRPGDAAIGNLHPGECGEQSCVRGANGRQPRVLGRRTGDGPGDAASGNLQPGPGQRRGQFTCRLDTDGTVSCAFVTAPGGTFTQVNTGTAHVCGVQTDSTLACWGSNGDGEATPPAGSFTQVSAGGFHTCGVTIDSSRPAGAPIPSGRPAHRAGRSFR